MVERSSSSSGRPTIDGAPVGSSGGNTFTRRGVCERGNDTMILPIIGMFCIVHVLIRISRQHLATMQISNQRRSCVPFSTG